MSFPPMPFLGPSGGIGLASGMQAATAASEARSAKTAVEVLAARHDRLALVCEALWTLLRDRLEIDEKDLRDLVHEIDLSDGRLDGKVRRPCAPCPDCGRTVAAHRPACIYCGALVGKAPFAT